MIKHITYFNYRILNEGEKVIYPGNTMSMTGFCFPDTINKLNMPGTEIKFHLCEENEKVNQNYKYLDEKCCWYYSMVQKT